MANKSIVVEVAYATPERMFLVACKLPENATIRDAFLHINLAHTIPELDIMACDVGIYSQPKTLSDTLNHNDRIEIYRPLEIDPKQARLKKAKKNK